MTKHLKLFTSDSERQSFESSNYYVEPYVSIVRGVIRYTLIIIQSQILN